MTRTRAGDRPRLLLTVNDAGFFLSDSLPIALAARAVGYDVHIATAPGPAVGRVVALGLSHHPVPISRRGLNPLVELRCIAALYRLYRRLRPDIAHHMTIKPVLHGGMAARLARVPAVVSAIFGLGYVFVERGRRLSVLRRIVHELYRLALRQANGRVIFQNPDDRDAFVSDGLVQVGQAVLIKGSGVDLARFAPAPEPPGTPLVVLPTRMLWDKGVGEFVAAARRLRAGGVKARFVLVGDTDPGNPSAIPPARLAAWREDGAVEWWGHRDDMPAVLAAAHIVCLPSYREGLPKSLIEAAACARPIVATDVPGCREIARDGDNALLVPTRDDAALATALARLLDDPALRQTLGARGRAIAEVEFSVDRVVEQTLAVYDALLAKTGATRANIAEAPDARCTPS